MIETIQQIVTALTAYAVSPSVILVHPSVMRHMHRPRIRKMRRPRKVG